ncbi:MAG: PAS domain S-box protein [Candidatus Methanosuratincola sp.]
MEEHKMARLVALLLRVEFDLEEVSDAVLEEAKRATGSTLGFVGTIDPKTGALVGHTTRKVPGCAVQGVPAREPVALKPGSDGKYPALLGHALNTKIPFYTNSPGEHPASKGTPAGHVPIRQFLAVPVSMDAHFLPMGLIALANPEKGEYNGDDLEHVCRVAYFFALALQRRLLEDAVRRSRDRYMGLFEGAPVPLFVIREDGVFEMVNRTFCALTGYTKEDIEGKSSWQEFVHPEDLERLRGYRRRRLAGEEAPNSYEVKVMRKDGTVVECQLYIVSQKGGEILGALADLTEVKRAKRELERANKELEKYSEHLKELVEEKTRELVEKERLATVGQVALMVGHDLRNPLQAVMNLAFIMKEAAEEARMCAEEPACAGSEQGTYALSRQEGALKEGSSAEPQETAREHLFRFADTVSGLAEKLEKGARYMDKIVSDLQELGRPFNPERDLSRVSLRSVLDLALSGVDVPGNVELLVEGGEDEDVVIPQQLTARALKNLVINAVQAMPDGGRLTLGAKILHTPAPAEGKATTDTNATGTGAAEAVFTVSDTGAGIPPGVMKELFKPFRTTKAKGTGLGLAIVKRIADAVGGSVEVESAPGKGTKFTLRVPVKFAPC